MSDNLTEHDNCFDQDEEILDWKDEAAAIIQDVKHHVKEIFVSELLPSSNSEIFINIKTLEDEKFCIRGSASGFQVVGSDFDKTDCISDDPENFYETPYSLLTQISQRYVDSFANQLSQKLNALQ